jgi:hypothetical protein
VTDISPLQEFNNEVLDKDVHLFKIEPKIQWTSRFRGRHFGQRQFRAPNEPSGMVVYYYLRNEISDKVEVKIMDLSGKEINSINGNTKAGLHKVIWDMRAATSGNQTEQTRFRRRPMVAPGEYLVVLQIGETKLTQRAQIRKMPGN